MSYFVPWNSYKNYQIAKEHGFHDLTHEWDRTHHAENFDQIDSRAYLVHSWLKYPKFGHAAATDYTARYIRYGMMTREEAIPIIKARMANWTRCACVISAISAATPRASSGRSWISSITVTCLKRTTAASGC